MAISYSPLRYPGGKSRLTNFMKLVIRINNLNGGVYVEPFAGGSGVAIGLLLDDYVERIIINDIDPAIYAFWHSVLNHAEEFCDRINATPVIMDEWYKQKQVLKECDTTSLLELGFATFFMNRTNRSGILNAGVIGGKRQTGLWSIDARFPKEKLINKIQKIFEYRDLITLNNLDVRDFIQHTIVDLPPKSLVYYDPPYFAKGQKLYLNALQPDDHILIAHSIKNYTKSNWIISYDNTTEIKDLYSESRQAIHSLNYTAANRYHGSEIIIYSNDLIIPEVENPFSFPNQEFKKMLKAV